MYTLSPPVDSNAPPPHTRAQMCSPHTLRNIPSFNYTFHVWCLLTYILSKFSLASFSCLRELSETVWEYCVLVLTVLPLSICLTHGFYLERHSSNCVTTNILQNFICITIYNRCAMKVGQYERPFKIGIESLWGMMEGAFFSWMLIVLWWSVYLGGKGEAYNKLAYLIHHSCNI